MNDDRIVELYWKRNESAITETAAKYGNYLNRISYNILANREDALECVNDTYHDKCFPMVLVVAIVTVITELWVKVFLSVRNGKEDMVLLAISS